ncbi:MAG: type II toxin-antitoxin system RelE/ParE family toxin [Comamonadaceae bacterium]|nr:type II toxin-antitoxin system RelE/ParE family toxin [Comamonadaceae bacterium]
MNYSFHDLAAGDVIAAQDYYLQNAGSAVAKRFTNELDRVIQLLLVNPGFGTPAAKHRRSYPLKDFPFSLIYQIEGEQLRILVVRHQRQRPSFGSSRH